MTGSTSSYSQFSEDRQLAEIFGAATGCCLEVGAFDGVTGSTTLAFEQRGWQAILVEPLPEMAALARSRRRGPVFAVAAGPHDGYVVIRRSREDIALSGVAGIGTQEELQRLRRITFEAIEVRQLTLDQILSESRVARLDFATIDVEGFESSVLMGFDLERWRPRVVILEDNSRGLDPTVPTLMARRGYRRFRTTGVNDWYARRGDRPLVSRRALARDAIRIFLRRCRPLPKRILPSPIKRLLRRLGAGYR